MREYKKDKRIRQKQTAKLSVAFKVGVGLIILSTLKYVVLIGIPFLSYSRNTKLVIGSGLIVAAEIMFWVGAVLVGKEVIEKYRKYLNPLNWFKNKVSPASRKTV